MILAKEVLVRKVPGADPDEILGAKYKPVIGKSGGVEYESIGHASVDFTQLAERFNDFGLEISHAQLKDLNRIRNDIEHLYTNAGHEAVREAIAKAFPVVVQLFRLASEDPRKALGDAWQTMLEVRSFYESERRRCEMTFEKVDWKSDSLAEAPKLCPKCSSLLVEGDPANTDFQSADATCRACGEQITAGELVEAAIDEHLALSHRDIKHGEEPIHTTCHECSLKTFILAENRCAWCHASLGTCSVCDEQLTPDNVDVDDHRICSDHGYVLSKDD